jgi:FtsH-binding integral membrane protein
MSNFFGFSSSSASHPPLQALLSFAPLSPPVRQHVAGVYSILAGMMGITVVAVQADLRGWVPRMHPLLSAICMLVSYVAFSGMSPTKENQNIRRGCLAAFAAFKGLSLGPFVEIMGLISSRYYLLCL